MTGIWAGSLRALCTSRIDMLVEQIETDLPFILGTRTRDPWGGKGSASSCSRQPPLCGVCVGHF
jgi:hypothetical protein